ncbi:MAG: radical SAM protein [Candidatus Dojkabacteria bacterium]|nr:radical SAM protein [Candidatus Dojkabacteria bacterium]
MKKICFLVSGNCFGNCNGCYLDKREGKELTLEEISKLASTLKNTGYLGITLSGGDPLIREDILDIINIFFSLDFNIHLDTTGIPLLRKEFSDKFIKAQMAKKISLIGIPFDGSSQKVAEEFRTNWEDILKQTKTILKILNNNDFKITINTVVHKNNIDDLNNIYEEITQYPNIQRWELHQFVSLSEKSKGIKNLLGISKKTFTDSIKKIKNFRNIEITPKVSHNKSNFKYIDFNGDVVILKEGEKSIINNIRNLNDEDMQKLFGGI